MWPSRSVRTRSTVLLIALRIAYAYNWFTIGPALGVLSAEFALSPAAWGILVGAFLVGAGSFQVPSGLLARRYGTLPVTLAGAALLGLAATASAAAPSYGVLVALRFLAGAGAGLFFSPAIALVGSLHPEGERGVPVGIFSSAFSAGAGLGLFVPSLLVPVYGWRVALLSGGVVLLAITALAVAEIPRTLGRPGPSARARGPLVALRSRGVWAIGLAFVGLEGTSLSTGQYFVPYALGALGWTPALAGSVAALFVFPSVFGGPLGGRLTERFTNRRTQMVVATAAPAALLAAVPFVGLGAVAAIGFTFAFGYGMVYAMMYVLAPYLPGLPPEEVPLAIGLFNGIQLVGGAAVAAVVADIVEWYGYTAAWEAQALLTIAPLVLLLALPVTRATVPGAGRSAATTPIGSLR